MKQIIADYIDQLDLALDQISYNDRNYDRFAFLLIDNCVEFFLYQYAKNYNSYNQIYKSEGKDYSTFLIKALDNHFDDKVNYAVITSYIERDIGNTIKYLHHFRNSSYHEGVRHENILHSLSIFYLKLTCQMISLFKPSYYSISSSDKISFRAMKYLGVDDFPFDGKKWFKAFIRLTEVADCLTENLKEDLLNDLSKIIDNANENIDNLVNNSSEHLTRKEVIKYYSPKYKSDPIESWLKVKTKLDDEIDYKKCFIIYCNFMADSKKLRLDLENAMFAIDTKIQFQLDSMRDK